MHSKHTNTRFFGMTWWQLVAVGFLFIMVLLLFVLFSWFVFSVQNKEAITSPLLVYINLSTHQLSDNRVLVRGSTNLPDHTIIMVWVRDEQGEYSAQDKVTVSKGKFEAGPFSWEGSGLRGGWYTVEALMPYPSVQPESVRRIIGERGEFLVGSQVIFDDGVLVRAIKRFEVIVPTPSPLPMPTPTVTPVKIPLTRGDIGKSWSNGERRISLLSVYRTPSLNGVKPFGKWHGGYEAGFTQFLVINLRLERLKPGYEDFYMTAFWLWAYTPDKRVEYQADQYLYKSPRVIRVYYQKPVETSIAFEVLPTSHNFIMCYKYGIAIEPSGKIAGECGSIGNEFKFGD
ncbi:MAG: hypothetical protein GXO35_07515 [Gammaproteobacteria bacterium]|nr:hypothetical protein [Gammaproteobacteria bacterium]